MTRTPISQRRIQTIRSTMMVALGAAHAMYYVTRWFLLCAAAMNYAIESRMLRKIYFISHYNSGEIMRQMVYQSDTTSLTTIRMNIYSFTTLCDILESRVGLSNRKYMNADEQVAMFLHTLAHNEKNKIIINRFQRSGETISRYFKLVLNATCRLHKEFYKTPVPVPNEDLDERWKWFKGCLGALDGTYVTIRVPTIDRKPYRTRKGLICTNVHGVCTRNLQFTYVLAGWRVPQLIVECFEML